ncbi:hypothetical protein BCR34DRAFT_179453 [Clohesyomyces aquaticus]|uniref:Glycosyltransferase family 31 protein n=1 Tax=Clohesyomyces aquaticus TaxID=1231657 RepID=A0A1Y1YF37_9PLEO|nr:hypothetical protein BCR34DRAFT_179453 [Clohesyomyces aquaticus]
MPVLTPSRVAVVVLSLSLLSFLWTFGLPRQIATPSFPAIHHDVPHVPAAPADTWRPAEPLEIVVSAARTSAATAATAALHDSHVSTPTPTSTATTTLRPLPSTNATLTGGTNATGAADKEPDLTADQCKDVAGAGDVMVIVKTSKAEIYQKLPTHLLTLLSCVPNFAIFSDHAGTIDSYPVYDALSSITNASKSAHAEFREYEKMALDPSSRPETVDKELDKWKILPMVYEAYKLKPGMRFYVFMEADTSLSWTNLLLWTRRLDYRIPYYSGAPSYLGTVKFAQRGSGILLSQGAMRQYSKLYQERYVSDWEPRVGKECCGDMVLATALTESAVEYYSAFPIMQGESPGSLDWTERHWCAPVVSWHHMTADDIDMLWGFQKSWTKTEGWDKAYLFKNAFYEFVDPILTERKEEWDNLSQDIKIRKPGSEEGLNSEANMAWYKFSEKEKNATQSVDMCESVCKERKECLQWRWRREECLQGKVVRLGRKSEKREGKENEGWSSGWMVDRIRDAVKEWGQCEEPSWKWNQ